MKQDAVIFDVDGTLANVEAYRFHVLTRPKNFDAFHAASIDAPAHDWVLQAMRDHRKAGRAGLVVTARSDEWLWHTLLWLQEKRAEHDAIFMRRRGDFRKDYEVKKDILREIRAYYNPVLAYDDNPNILRLWQEEGIPAIEVPGWVEED